MHPLCISPIKDDLSGATWCVVGLWQQALPAGSNPTLCVGSLSFENHYTTDPPVCAVSREVPFVLHKDMDDFYRKAAFSWDFDVLEAIWHEIMCNIFWWLSFLHIWEPGCAIFLRYTKYYTNENAGKILDHRGLRSFDLYICTYPAQYASISLIRAPYKARLSGRSACHACKH